MGNIRYNSIGEGNMKTYIFHAAVEQEDDGRWRAWVEALPGCAVWGYSREEAIERSCRAGNNLRTGSSRPGGRAWPVRAARGIFGRQRAERTSAGAGERGRCLGGR